LSWRKNAASKTAGAALWCLRRCRPH